MINSFNPEKAGEIREAILKRRFEPTNVIDYFQKKANKIKHDNIYNNKYEYFKKTAEGFAVDNTANKKFGDDRKGYELWKQENPEISVGYAGVTSARILYNRENPEEEVGYIFETKLSDEKWHNEIKQLEIECFDKLCDELDVVDKDTFKYFIFQDDFDLHHFKSSPFDRLNNALDVMTSVYNKYCNDAHYKIIIDKIKK